MSVWKDDLKIFWNISKEKVQNFEKTLNKEIISLTFVNCLQSKVLKWSLKAQLFGMLKSFFDLLSHSKFNLVISDFSVDNSEYMRNGDFLPTRLQAQQDAVGIIAQSKLRSNPESNVGLLSLSGLVEGENLQHNFTYIFKREPF